MRQAILHHCRLRATTATAAPLKRSCLAINGTRSNSTACRPISTATRGRGSQLAGPLPLGGGRMTSAGFGVMTTVQERRGLASSSGKSEADEMVEELQDLYEIAKDEFEIATESTSSSTIYASSDRSTAREALTDLESLYKHYTSPPSTSPTTTASPTTSPNPADSTPTGPTPASPTGRDETRATELEDPEVDPDSGTETGEASRRDGSAGGGVKANFNAEAIAPEVREEIRRRVGQRVRELRNAVEALEERAMEE